MNETEKISLSVLVTREEYGEAAVQHYRHNNHRQSVHLLLLGILFVILGFSGAFFGHYISLSFSVSFCLILFGVFLSCYSSLVAPLLIRGAAVREFDEKEELRYATMFEFFEKTMIVKNGRVEGKIPLEYITEWFETASIFSLSCGREFQFAIPKRLLTENQTQKIREHLANNTNS